jgi:hypothetical protein
MRPFRIHLTEGVKLAIERPDAVENRLDHLDRGESPLLVALQQLCRR